MTFPVLAGIRPPSIGSAQNGHISADALVNVGGTKIRMLAAEAAEQFVRLRNLIRVEVGVELGILPGGAYRSYDEQVGLFRVRYQTPPVAGRSTRTWEGKVWSLRPGVAMAAVPGTSNHGLGAAVDVCEMNLDTGQYMAITSSAAWPWLLDNATSLGWSWELQSEPWHLRLVALPETPPAPHPPGDDMATYFSVDTHPDDIYAIGPDGGVHHITGPEGAVLEAVTPGWAQGRKVITLTPEVDAALPR